MSHPMRLARHRLSLADATPPFFAGVDLGGTTIKIGLVDKLGGTLAFTRRPTEIDKGPDDGARRMSEAVTDLIREVGLGPQDVVRVGLGTPGTMDVPAGMLLEPHNLPGWFDFPIRDRLAQYCEKPVTFANDATAAAYGEYWLGSGRDFRSMVLLTLGTGVGGGIVTAGRPIEGEHSHGAECGHLLIDYHDTARLCPCGKRGHLEGYASATAVIQRTREALSAGRDSSLQRRANAGDAITPLMVAQEAEAGDDLARELVLDTARYLGIGIVSLVHTIDPDGVVLGGAMTFGGHDRPLGIEFLQRVRDEFRRRAFPVLADHVVIDFASLGGDAGYLGAAGLARVDQQQASAGPEVSHA